MLLLDMFCGFVLYIIILFVYRQEKNENETDRLCTQHCLEKT